MFQYQYVVLPAVPFSELEGRLQDELYINWHRVWNEVFSQVGQVDAVNPDDFYKQKIIVSILKNGVPIGMHLYSFYNLALKSCQNQSYFSGLPDEVKGFLKTEGITRVMTMEYLTVFPEFRKSVEGVKWGEVFISLGTRLLDFTECDYALGTARQDLKVNKMGTMCNFKTSSIVIQKYDYACEVMYFKKGDSISHSDPEYHKLITNLWDSRLDYSGISGKVNEYKKVA